MSGTKLKLPELYQRGAKARPGGRKKEGPWPMYPSNKGTRTSGGGTRGKLGTKKRWR